MKTEYLSIVLYVFSSEGMFPPFLWVFGSVEQVRIHVTDEKKQVLTNYNNSFFEEKVITLSSSRG